MTTSGFPRKRKKKAEVYFLGIILLFTNMAGSYRTSPGSSSESRRESLEMTNQSESFAFDSQFLQSLRELPDELVRLQRENKILKKEVKASPSR